MLKQKQKLRRKQRLRLTMTSRMQQEGNIKPHINYFSFSDLLLFLSQEKAGIRGRQRRCRGRG